MTISEPFIRRPIATALHIQVNPQALAERHRPRPGGHGTLGRDARCGKGQSRRVIVATFSGMYFLSYSDAQQFNNVIVAYSNGAPVELKDLGRVIDSSVSPRTGSWFGATPCELLLIELRPGANTIRVVNQIKAMLPQLQQSIPRAVHVELVSDRSANIRASVSDVEFTLVLTVGLVVLVIFAFLRKLWATIIPSITLPLGSQQEYPLDANDQLFDRGRLSGR